MVVDMDNLDLAAPEDIEKLMQLTDESEEEIEGIDDESKRQAAFVKLRKEKKTLRDALQKSQEHVKELSSKGNSPQQQQFMPVGGLTPQMQRAQEYQDSVDARAAEMTRPYANVAGMTQEKFDSLYWKNRQAIVGHDAAVAEVQKYMESRAPSVVEDVLGKFKVLDGNDKTELKKRIGQLNPEAKTDPKQITREVHSYLGEHLEKFATPGKQEDGKQTPTAKPEETEGFPIRSSPLGSEESLAAAAASEGKGGSPGIKLSQKEQGKGAAPTSPQLSKDDRAEMKELKLNPNSPEDAKRHLRAKRKLASE